MKLIDSPRKCKNPTPIGVRLILVEEGATAFEPPMPAGDVDQSALEVAVLMQSIGEPGPDFVERTARRVASLERADRTITELILAAGPGHDDVALGARVANARAVLAHMLCAGRGEIVFVARSGEHSDRHELLALAGTLTSEATGSVSIRVLFEQSRAEQPERKSGIQALLSSGHRGQDVADALAAG